MMPHAAKPSALIAAHVAQDCKTTERPITLPSRRLKTISMSWLTSAGLAYQWRMPSRVMIQLKAKPTAVSM